MFRHTKFRLPFWSPLLPVAAVLGYAMLAHGCANTTTPPSGGPKDTIPPVLRKVEPLPGTVGVPTRKPRLEFTFDEYVKVKDPKSIFLSPPLEKAPLFRMRGKTLVVYFESDLDSLTTYSLDLTGAVVDNNEGNPFPGYTLVFSTGDQIDSMMVTGIIQDCQTLKPVKGATVMLYKDQADSALFLHRPNAAAKTDDWGYFSIRNIQDTVYRVYAILDANSNNLYETDNERIAFLDTLFRPTMVVRDSLPELMKYDMKDTAACLARRTELEMNMFREKPSKQLIVKKERVGWRTAYITFMAPNAEVDSIWIRDIRPERLITQFNPQRDSLEIWVNDPRRMPDTLKMFVKYKKTDTLGVLQPTVEEVKLVIDKKLKAEAKTPRRNLKHEDTLCVLKPEVSPETVEQYGFTVEFQYPLVADGFDSLVFRSVNPRQKETIGRYRVTRDSLNLRRYTVMPEEKLQEGYEYFLKFPHRKFQDINGFWNDSTEVKVSLPKDENLSTLILHVSGAGGHRYLVDLLNEKRDKVLRSFQIRSDQTLTFPYVKAGKYSIRVTEDLNGNGIVDTGNLLERRQPEKVRFFKIDESSVIDIPQRTEWEQDLDLVELFK